MKDRTQLHYNNAATMVSLTSCKNRAENISNLRIFKGTKETRRIDKELFDKIPKCK